MVDTQTEKDHKNLKYRDLTFRVESSDSSHLTWLEEFLCPQFQVVEDGPYDCKVAVVEDPSQYEETLRRGRRADEAQLDCFALDNRLVRLPIWTSLGDEQILFDEESKVFYLLGSDIKGPSEVRILTGTVSISARMPLMKVLREFAMKHSQRAGGVVLHGSSFLLGKKGVIIAGPKAAGKTTLLIHALREGASHYLSNDRVVVSFTEHGPMLYGMPTLVAIRQPTVEMFPDLHRRLLGVSYNHHLSLSETAERPAGPTRPWRNGKIGLTPAQFCALLEVPAIAEAQAWALVLPHVTGERGTIELAPVAAQSAAARLVDALFGGPRWRNASDTFSLVDDGAYPDETVLRSLCFQFTSQVRCFDCRLGTEAYDNKHSAVNLINQLLQQT